jgi:PKD repeat protein
VVGGAAAQENVTAEFSHSPSDPVPDERVTFDASASTASTTIAEYRWYVDGSRQYNDDSKLTREFDTYGEYDVRLEVEGENGTTAEQIRTVTVAGDGPTAAFEYDPAAPVPDERVTFDAAQSGSSHGEIVEYRWYVDGSRQYNDDSKLTYEFDEYGDYDVELVVEDNGGKSDTLIESVSVAGNGPTAEFDHSPSTPAPGEQVTFDAGPSTAPDGEIVEYRWYVDGSRQYNDDSTLTYEFDEYGEYDVELYVADNGGKSQTRTKTITVDGDGPQANFTFSPDNPELSDRVIFDGSTSTAPDTEIIEYDWYINGESQYGGDTEFSYTFSEYGTYDVELQVEDSGGKTDRIVRTVTVGDKADIVDNPEFELARDGPSTRSIEVRPGETGTFRAEIVAESVPVAESRLLVNGEVVADRTVESVTQRFSYDFAALGEQNVELEAVGPAGQSATVEWTVHVRGDKPEIESVQPTIQQFDLRTGDTQTFGLTATSGQSPTLDYQWTVDGAPVGSADSLEYTFAEAGMYTVAGTVTDAGGQTVSQTWNVSVSAFRSRPSFASQTTADQLSPGTESELFTFSIRNPDVNTQDANIEIITELPNGVSITGARDVTEGDAGLQALVGTVPPGSQESMRLRLQVTDESLRGEELTIPYQIRYYPRENPDQYAVFAEERLTVTVAPESSPDRADETASSQTADSTPGFTIITALLSLLGISVLGYWRKNGN